MTDQFASWSAESGLSQEMEQIDALPHRAYLKIRAAVDPLVALVALLVCFPILVIIALAIRIDTPGPALFRQRRVGRNGKPFTIIKFRTLIRDSPQYSLKLSDHDPVVTRLGSFLRRTGLDEVPQLFNVVSGDMAVIGPRPEQVELIGLYKPWQHRRLLVKPGITGWWQIHHRDGVPLHLNVEKDLYYIENLSWSLDLRILFGTAKLFVNAVKEAFHPRASDSDRGGDVVLLPTRIEGSPIGTTEPASSPAE